MRREEIANLESVLGLTCAHYEKSAPTVAAWADDLYIRLRESPDSVVLSELTMVYRLAEPEWMHPNYAANAVYKLMHRLGRDTTGHAGY